MAVVMDELCLVAIDFDLRLVGHDRLHDLHDLSLGGLFRECE
jgi:hypothetical protein